MTPRIVPAMLVCSSIASLSCLVAANQQPQASAPALERRWVYCAFNLQVDESVPRLEQIMTRAAAAGYNGVLLADYKFNVLDRVPDRYFKNVARIRQKAAELKLDIIPAVMPIGYSEGLLTHDPNLAEGIPVRDQLLIVEGKTARIEPDPPVELNGGDFENAKDDKFAGWDFQDLIGRASFLDTEVKHAGNSSLRVHNISGAEREHGNCRVTKRLKVSPFRQYHLSAWIKTRKFQSHPSVRMFAMGGGGLVLSHSNLGVKETQDWTPHHVLFNSLDNAEVTVYCGVWGGKEGTLWLDDLRIEETAFVNLLRREGCPLTLSRDGGSTLREGYDFAKFHDAKMGQTPWPGGFDVYHEPPKLALEDTAALRDSERLRASYYHAVTIYDGQVPCCLSDPKVFEIAAKQVADVQRLLEPRGFMMSHDEIRVAGWCGSCQDSKQKRTPGQLLADNARRCVEIIRQVNPQAEIFVWSDMFDPSHNAVDKFYLVNGSLAGSWDGLPKDVTIVNWNHGGRAKSLPFFAKRGHKQILAGYYDGSPDSIAEWLRAAGTNSNVIGVMYTTWQNRYDDLEAFARAAWGENSALQGDTVGVRSVAFSPDGKRIVSGGYDRLVKLRDAATAQEIGTLKGHTGAVNSVAFSPDGKRIASAGFDRTVKLWDAATGQEIGTLKGHTDSIWRVAFSPDGKRLASGGYDRTVKLWEIETGREIETLKGHTGEVWSVVFSPDGTRIASASTDQSVKLWDAATGEETGTLTGHTGKVYCVAFSPDGRRIVSASSDKTVRFWDAATNKDAGTLKGHAAAVRSVAFSPNGTCIASASDDGIVKLWDVATGQKIDTMNGHTGLVYSVAFSPDGTRIASAGYDGTVKLWDVRPIGRKKN